MNSLHEPIYSEHPARNNRIKALLKRRDPKKYFHLTTTHHYVIDETNKALMRHIRNRLSAIKCRENFFTMLNDALLLNQQLRQIVAHTHEEMVLTSITIKEEPSQGIKHHVEPSEPNDVIKKIRNRNSARLSRQKQEDQLKRLRDENCALLALLNPSQRERIFTPNEQQSIKPSMDSTQRDSSTLVQHEEIDDIILQYLLDDLDSSQDTVPPTITSPARVTPDAVIENTPASMQQYPIIFMRQESAYTGENLAYSAPQLAQLGQDSNETHGRDTQHLHFFITPVLCNSSVTQPPSYQKPVASEDQEYDCDFLALLDDLACDGYTKGSSSATPHQVTPSSVLQSSSTSTVHHGFFGVRHVVSNERLDEVSPSHPI